MKRSEIGFHNIDIYIRDEIKKARENGKRRKFFKWSKEHFRMLQIWTNFNYFQVPENGSVLFGCRHFYEKSKRQSCICE